MARAGPPAPERRRPECRPLRLGGAAAVRAVGLDYVWIMLMTVWSRVLAVVITLLLAW